MKRISYISCCVTVRDTFKCVKPETFIKRATAWYCNIDPLRLSVKAFEGFCMPSTLQFEDYLTRTVQGALDSLSLGFEGLNSVYTFKINKACQIYIYVTYISDLKEWHLTLDFSDRYALGLEKSEDTNDTPEDTNDTPEDTNDTPEDTNDTPEDTNDTPEDTNDTPEDTKSFFKALAYKIYDGLKVRSSLIDSDGFIIIDDTFLTEKMPF